MDNQQLQKRIDDLQKELNDLKTLFYKDNFPSIRIFNKDIQVNKTMIFPTADTTAAGAYKGRIKITVNGVTQYLHYYDA